MLLAAGFLAATFITGPIPDRGAFQGEVAVEAVGTSGVAVYVDTNGDASFDERFLLESGMREDEQDVFVEDADGHRVRRMALRESLSLPLHFAAASVEFESGYVRVIAEDQVLELFVEGSEVTPWNPRGIRVWRQAGYGLSHSVGETGIAISRPGRRGDITTEFCDASSDCDPGDSDSGGGGGGGGTTLCDAGGPGSTNCSVSQNGSACSATCATGYYSCCMNGTPAKCRCIRG